MQSCAVWAMSAIAAVLTDQDHAPALAKAVATAGSYQGDWAWHSQVAEWVANAPLPDLKRLRVEGILSDVRRPYLAMRRNNQKTARFDDLLKDEYIIMLLQGRSTNGEMIYCYLKVYMPDIDRFKEALRSNANFNAFEFGEMVAAGKGDPSPEVKEELAKRYPMFANPVPVK